MQEQRPQASHASQGASVASVVIPVEAGIQSRNPPNGASAGSERLALVSARQPGPGWLLGLLLAFISVVAPAACAAQQPVDGEAALREGRYQEAIRFFEARVGQADATSREHRLFVQALAEAGRYDDAIEAARRARAASPRLNVELARTFGEVLLERGRLAEAETAFREAVNGRAADRLSAELNLAILQYERGERDAAMQAFDRFIDYYNDGTRLTADDLIAVATAVRFLGEDDPQLFKDALRAYDEAIELDPQDLRPQLLVGELFLQKYQAADAQQSLQEVLRVNPNHARALLAAARVLEFDGDPRGVQLAQNALEINPNLVGARVYMARVHTALEEFDDATQEIERALEVNPASLEALSVLASIQHLEGERSAFETTRARIEALNPQYAELYVTLAELSVQQRQYQQAVDFARQAVSLNPRYWPGHVVLGMNLLRVGRIEEGRTSLETAFAGDPYHVWAKNTLDLLDTFARFQVTRTPHFEIAIHERESSLLAPYVAAIAEEAFAKLTERYGGSPPTPIRLELFPSHADFAVRTLGVPGLGALGVSFGAVIAMDSPSARNPGEFNWGSTLWHELSHSFHLALSDHRVPRWFTEGLAVLEERHAREGWGAGPTPPFVFAMRDDQLLPIRDLNNGFVRPRYPDQVTVSYYHASLVLEKVERDHGFQALRQMLRGYAEGRSTEELFRSVLRTDIDTFDQRFRADLQQRFGRTVAGMPARQQGPGGGGGRAGGPGGSPGAAPAPSRDELERRIAQNPDDFAARLSLGRLLFEDGQMDAAVPHLERARDVYPEYGGGESPYVYLARIFRARGDLRRAADNLGRLILEDETSYAASLEYADVLEELGQLPQVAAALERALYVYPYPLPLHNRLAATYARVEQWDSAVRARSAILALNPVDRASALYELAYAQFRAGDTANARRNVLRALEEAPHYREAQDLLLQLSARSMAPDPDPGTPGRRNAGIAALRLYAADQTRSTLADSGRGATEVGVGSVSRRPGVPSSPRPSFKPYRLPYASAAAAVYFGHSDPRGPESVSSYPGDFRISFGGVL